MNVGQYLAKIKNDADKLEFMRTLLEIEKKKLAIAETKLEINRLKAKR